MIQAKLYVQCSSMVLQTRRMIYLNHLAYFLAFAFVAATTGFISLRKNTRTVDFQHRVTNLLPLNDTRQPLTPNDILRGKLSGSARHFIATAVLFSGAKAIHAKESGDSILAGLYTDTENRFVVVIPPAWLPNPKKLPAPNFSKFQKEQLLLSATSFAEGASFGITATQAARLLKDFDIDWWFAPLQTLPDVGSPSMIANLLILQRQEEFESRQTNSNLIKAVFDENKRILYFSFESPISEGVYRQTIAKAVLKDGLLYTIWISALKSVFDSDYGDTLENIRSSFLLL